MKSSSIQIYIKVKGACLVMPDFITAGSRVTLEFSKKIISNKMEFG
jgi:hypothetical protein